MSSILLVDDEAIITTQLEERLTRMGYSVVGRASTAVESIEMARALLPDLILMDIVMPGDMDGIDASRIIIEETGIPVVFLTAYGDDTYINRAREIGPAGYILKPYREEEVKAAIEIALFRKKTALAALKLTDIVGYLVDLVPCAACAMDERGSVIHWNAAAARLFGYEAAEAAGASLDRYLDEAGRDLCRQALSGRELTGVPGDGFMKELNLRCITRSGETPCVCLSLAPWRRNDELLYTCLFRKNDGSKFAADGSCEPVNKHELMLKDIHHRVKNNLQIITSLLSLQSRHTADEKTRAMFLDSQSRVQSIALVYERLYRSSDMGAIDCAEYLTIISRDLYNVYCNDHRKVSVRLDLRPVQVDHEKAVSCGLLVTEILSNSFKHAFPAGWEGEGIVSIGLAPSEDGGVELTVSDNGVGMPAGAGVETKQSLGMMLIDLLARRLDGFLEITREKGTTVRVRFTP